jgi:uncharacterized membrane protein
MNNRTRNIVYAAIIGALYVVLTEFAAMLGLASQPIQLRFSEALNALCLFTPYGIPGMFIGCLIANLVTGAVVWDVIFGSIATLIGAIGVYLLRKNKILALVCPVVSNAVIIPFVLTYAYGLSDGIWYFVLTVGIGQIISCTVLGYFLAKAVDKRKKWLFRQ